MGSGNVFGSLPTDKTREHFEPLLEAAGFKLERIVSFGQATPSGEWHDQDQAEWVILLQGSAGLRIEGEASLRELTTGDYVYLPAHCRHRVEWTRSDGETVWLALHHQP